MDFRKLKEFREKIREFKTSSNVTPEMLKSFLDEQEDYLSSLEEEVERFLFMESIADSVDLNIAANADDESYAFCNQNTAEVFGLEVDEMLNKRPIDILLPEQAAVINEANQRVRRENRKFEFETELQTVDGLRQYNITKGPLELTNGTKLIYTIGRDVTEQRALEKEKELFREILLEALNTIPEGFVVYDQEDRLFLCNQAYLDIYHTSKEAIKIGARFEDIIRWGVEKGQYPQAGNSEEEINAWVGERMEMHLNPPEGAIIQKTDEGRWLKIDERRTASGFIVGIRADVTKIKEAEELLKKQTEELKRMSAENIQARAKAEAAAVAKSNFLAIISHELRTPMTGIIGLTDLLMETAASDDQLVHLKNLKVSAGTLHTLLNDVLDYSKFEAGKLDFEQIDFDFKALLEEIRQLLQNNASMKGLGLEVCFEGEAQDYIFKSDPTRIRQVILNLASNAIKFSNSGIVKMAASIDNNCGDLRVDVQDHGIGIPDNLQGKLFKPFTQADETTTRKYGGTGLGLSICKMIVEGLGGEIGYESILGEGTTFTVRLPLAKGCRENVTNALSPGRSNTEGRFNYVTSIRVILAEDNQINRTIISTVLKRIGHIVVECENGQEAVDAFQETGCDVILMDMQMPILDGAEAARKIRKIDATIPIIALTADLHAGQNPLYEDAGFNCFLSKPVDWEKLEATIEALVFPS